MESRKSTELLGKSKPHPYRKSGFLSRLFFTWLFPLFYQGFHKDLSEEDLYPSLKQHDATFLGNRLSSEWEKQLQNKNPSLWRALFAVFGCEMAWLALLHLFIELICRLSQPLILAQLLQYYEPHSTMTRKEAFIYSGLMVASPALVMICQHNFMYYQFVMGVKIKIAATALVYRKALKLSRSSLAGTNVGQMVNLISNDVSRFESAVRHIHSLWLGPIEIIIIIVLLYFYVGLAGMTGVIVLVLLIPVQGFFGKRVSSLRMNTALRTDERIRLMNEVIQGMQVIKMYTWEKPFAKLVEISRWQEMQQIRKNATIKAIVYSFQLFTIKMAIYLCILVFVLTGNVLNAQFVYVVTSFYTILRPVVIKRFPDGVTHVAEAQISVKRIKKFLQREELDWDSSLVDVEKTHPDASSTRPKPITLKKVFVKWNEKLEDYSLQDVNMEVSLGELAVVIGPVGAGKTTLLHTILRELPPLRGAVEVNGSISYASQEPWLFMSSIRQNIVFGQPFDATRYEEVLKVCALERDLTQLPYGDKTLVGDRGITLSGGQKARVNLARAIYKEADIYLLDDPLSAVDTHVGKHIFKECIQQHLKDKCVVLVTHQLQYLRNAQHIYLMDNGTVHTSGSYEKLQKSTHDYAKLLVELSNKPEDDSEESEDTSDDLKKRLAKQEADNGPKVNKEGRAVGNVAVGVYRAYFQNGGHWCFAAGIFALFIAAQAIGSLLDYFVSWWVNAEAIKLTQQEMNSTNNTISTTFVQNMWLQYMTTDLALIVQSVLVLALTVFAIVRSVCFVRFALKASTNLHSRMFGKIVYASMRFFHRNPCGRILNRFSSDMNQVDETLPSTMLDCFQNALAVVSTTVVVATVNPWMIIPSVIIMVIFYGMRVVYIRTSRDVKRLESTTRSPVYSHLTASLQGLTTIRAFGAQEVLRKEFEQHQNRNSSKSILFIGVGRSFGLWLDMGCILYIFLVTFSFLFVQTDTLGGFVGLSITQSMTLTGMFQMCIRQWSELENLMTCVERIKEYVDMVPESDNGRKEPPKDWPSSGKITFKDLRMRYAVEEPTILKGLTFTIQDREKVGIVGRTGAGKSSILMALFRLAENEGLVAIDGIDTQSVNLERLRSSISIIPQEPVLFCGTVRKNLDPFDEYSDEVLWRALEDIELKDAVADLPQGLESHITEGGTNFSVGQRQLLCLARAIVRNNKILVLDEATANVDPQTDALIQLTIRRKFSNCTVLTIAHRLHTIMDSDKVLVMDAGNVAEFGSPFELLQNPDGVFTGMVEQTGRAMAQNLVFIAEKTHQNNGEASLNGL